MSDLDTFIAVVARSRKQEFPTRRTAGRVTSHPIRPVVPLTPANGVSSSEIGERFRAWGFDWPPERFQAVIAQCFALELLRRGPRGLYWSHAVQKSA